MNEELDRRIIEVLRRAGADAPDTPVAEAPKPGVGQVAGRGRVALIAASLLVAFGGVGVWWATTRTEPSQSPAVSSPDTMSSQVPPESAPASTSTVALAPTTTTMVETQVPVVPTFTPVTLGTPPDGYALEWARVDRSADGGLGMVRYSSTDGTGVLLIIRDQADFFAEVIALGRSTWDVGGRTVVEDGQGGGCSVDGGCSLGVQWDDRTAISVSWEPAVTGELAAHQTLESLLSVVAALTEVPATSFTPGPLWNESYVFGVEDPYQQPPLIAAGAQGANPVVILDVGDGPQSVSNIPARIALIAQDGRILIDPIDGSPELVLPSADPGSGSAEAGESRWWPEASPGGELNLQDIATIQGTDWVLATTEPGSCDTACAVQLVLAPLDEPEGRQVTLDLDVSASLPPTSRFSISDTGRIVGTLDGLASSELATFDGQRLAPATDTNIGDPTSPFITIDRTGNLTATLDARILTLTDINSGATRQIDLAGQDLASVTALDLVATTTPWERGIVVISRANAGMLIIDLADKSISTGPSEWIGIAALG